MDKLGAIARQDHVTLLGWTHASSFYTAQNRRAKLDEISGDGAMGAKVDFWCTDRQEAMEAITETFLAAAERHMVVVLHGCTLPRGWQRTYPNFLSAEAVLGAESYMYDDRFPEKAAELNTLLPFTRNVTGPMDSTPLGLAIKRYERKTTAAHELAVALIVTSGIIHYADTPQTYAAFPEAAREVLRDAPALWDETRCLAGEPGRLVVLARRAGATWFIAGLNGTAAPLSLDLDLEAFSTHPRRVLIQEGEDALRQLSTEAVSPSPRWTHQLPPRGGFVLRLDLAPEAPGSQR